jgi:hypothetical protein
LCCLGHLGNDSLIDLAPYSAGFRHAAGLWPRGYIHVCAFTPEVSGAAHRWPPSLHSGRLIRQRRRLIASDGHDAARGQQLRTGGRPPSERGACLAAITNQRPRRSTTIRRALKVRSRPLRSAVIAAVCRRCIVAPSAMHRCAARCVRAARRCDAPPSVWRVVRRFDNPLAAARAADLRGSSANGARRRGAASSQRQRQRLASGAGDEWPPHTRMLRRDRRGLCGPGALLKPQLRGRVRFNRRLDAIRAATLFAAGPPAPVRLPALPVQDAPSAQR